MNVRKTEKTALYAMLSLLCTFLFAQAGDNKIAELIEKLSSDSYRDREQATLDLWKIGIAAKKELEEAALSDEPERAVRSALVLRKVELRITPDTPQQVIDLVEKYKGGSLETKASILGQLRELKAYHQLLTLYALDTEEARTNLVEHVRGVAVIAAREALVANDEEGAIEILISTVKDPSSSRALASLYFHTGRRGEEFKKLRPEKVSDSDWSILLMRLERDTKALIDFARKEQKEKMQASLQLLIGDPIPWLELEGLDNGRDKVSSDYISIVKKRWNGDIMQEADYAPLLKSLKARDEREKKIAMTSLALLGRITEIRDMMEKDTPEDAFLYYVSLEEIPKALMCLGLDPEKPDYKGWVKKRFAELNDDDDEEGTTTESKLLIMANFLEKRGLSKELDQSFSEELVALADKDEGDFLEFLGGMMGSTVEATSFGVEQATKWAGKDEMRWNDIYTVSLGEDNGYTDWRAWIKQIDPKVSQQAILEALLAITQRSEAHGDLRERWMNKFWSSVEQEKDKSNKIILINRILTLAISQMDVATALKAWDMLDEDEKKKVEWPTIDKFYSAAGRWEEALKVLDASGEYENNPDPELNAYYAVHLRRAGKEEIAKKYDELAIKLSMGDVFTSARVANTYLYGGDMERSADWLQTSVYQANYEEMEFLAVLKPYTEAMSKKGDWAVAASCHEALIRIYAAQPLEYAALNAFARERLGADLMKAMTVLDDQRDHALRLLQGIHNNFVTDGVLADDFFPLLRKRGLNKELEAYFAESWKRLSNVAKKYPTSHITKNTAGWFASRAQIKLKEAEKMLEEALDASPEQSAYLDTFAEIKFALGDRNSAIRFSDRAMSFSPFDEMIRMQNERFRNAELPKK